MGVFYLFDNHNVLLNIPKKNVQNGKKIVNLQQISRSKNNSGYK